MYGLEAFQRQYVIIYTVLLCLICFEDECKSSHDEKSLPNGKFCYDELLYLKNML